MKKAFLSLLILHFSIAVFSQGSRNLAEQVERAKFEIIKKTVEFLTNDSKIFPDAKKKSCNNCTKYEEIEKFSEENKMKGVKELIKEFRNKKVDNSAKGYKNSLQSFSGSIKSKITTGNTDKSNRIKLPAYKAYESDLKKIVEEIKVNENSGNTEKDKDNDEKGKGGEAKANTPTGQIVSEPNDKSDSSVQPVQDLPTTINTNDNDNIERDGNRNYIYYGIIGVLMAIIGFLFYRGMKLQEHIFKKEEKIKSLEKSNEYSLINNTSKSDNLNTELLKLKEENENLRIQLAEERGKMERMKTIEKMSTSTISSQIDDYSNVSQEKQLNTQSELKYARYADQGDGFSINELLNEEDGETIFVVKQINANTANYFITGNNSAQKLALADISYFLSKACKYDIPNSPITKIVTNSPGELKLQGNKWLITAPAAISFV